MKYITIPLSDYELMQEQLSNCRADIANKVIYVRFAIHSLPFYSVGMSIDQYATFTVDDTDLDFKTRSLFNHITEYIKAEVERLKEEKTRIDNLKKQQQKVPNWILKLFN